MPYDINEIRTILSDTKILDAFICYMSSDQLQEFCCYLDKDYDLYFDEDEDCEDED